MTNGGDNMGQLGAHVYDADLLGTYTVADWRSHVGKRQTGARAEILGDPHRSIWEQHDESLEAFEKRVEEEAKALRQTTSG